MTQYPESGIKLIADTADYTSAMEEAIGLADQFDALGEMTVSISAELDTSNVSLDDLPLDGETVNFTVEADVQGDLTELPKDGETVNTTVDVTETETATKTLNAVQTLKNLKVMETVWNITGTAMDILGKVNEFAVKPMLNLDEAVAGVNAQTGGAIPNARELIRNIFYDDLGDSIDQVGKMTIKAAQMKAPIDDAVRAALTFTHTFQDENPEQVLETLNEMVRAKLAPNFTVASDMMVRAFQNGANKGGDLLKVVADNATAIHDLGLTGPESLSFIKTGLDNGFKSAQQVIDVLLKIKQNVTGAAGNATSDVSKTLKALGIANPAETGEAWSADFFEGVIEAIQNAPGMSDTEKEAMFSNLVGGKQGGKTFSAFLEMSPDDAAGIFKNVAGAAEDAASAADDSLSGAIDDFMLAAQEAADAFLSSDSIDLPGKINALKSGLQDALNVLANGGDLGQALTVALKPIGFDDEFQGLESALGNFVIGILQAVAQIQDLTGHGKEAAGTRTTIAAMGAQQLSFDLQVNNPDQLAASVSTALSRGVSADTIATSVSDAVDALISNGAVEAAQQLLDEIQTQGGIGLKVDPSFGGSARAEIEKLLGVTESGMLNSDGTIALNFKPGMDQAAQEQFMADVKAIIDSHFGQEAVTPVEIEPTLTPETVASLQAEVDGALKIAQDASHQAMLDSKDASLQLETTVATAATGLQTTATNTVAPMTTLTTQTTGLTNAATPAAPKVQAVADATKKQGDNAARAVAPLGNTADEMGSIAINAPIAASGLSALDMAIKQIITTANGLAAANDAVAQKQGQLDAQSSGSSGGGSVPAGGNNDPGIMAALQPYLAGSSFSSRGANSVTVNNVNIVQSEAQADAVGYSTAKQLRGVT